MNDDQLRKMLISWKQRLGLSSYRIRLEQGGVEDDDSYMEVHRATDYKRAVVHYQPWLVGIGKVPEGMLLRVTDEMVEESLVHELLHIVFTPVVTPFRVDLDGYLHRDVHDLLVKMLGHAEERVVDDLATALVAAFGTSKFS